MNRIVSIVLVFMMLFFVSNTPVAENNIEGETELKAGFNDYISDIEPSVIAMVITKSMAPALEIINNSYDEGEVSIDMPQDDIDMLATVVRAEAGNQPLEGKRAVVAVILNRVASDNFPNTIEEVLHQDGQFCCMTNGSYSKALNTKDDTDYEAVELEINDRAYDSWVFFRAGHYSQYGEPAGVIGDHYFSKEKDNGSNENEED